MLYLNSQLFSIRKSDLGQKKRSLTIALFAVLVVESAAVAAALDDQAEQLSGIVNTFKLHDSRNDYIVLGAHQVPACSLMMRVANSPMTRKLLA